MIFASLHLLHCPREGGFAPKAHQLRAQRVVSDATRDARRVQQKQQTWTRTQRIDTSIKQPIHKEVDPKHGDRASQLRGV